MYLSWHSYKCIYKDWRHSTVGAKTMHARCRCSICFVYQVGQWSPSLLESIPRFMLHYNPANNSLGLYPAKRPKLNRWKTTPKPRSELRITKKRRWMLTTLLSNIWLGLRLNNKSSFCAFYGLVYCLRERVSIVRKTKVRIRRSVTSLPSAKFKFLRKRYMLQT